MDSGKRYSDKEVKRIIGMALDLQRQESRSVERKDSLRGKEEEGFSLRELQSVGGEIGVNSDYIRMAVSEYEERRRYGGARLFLGASPRPEVRRDVELHVGKETLERALNLLPSLSGKDGMGNIVGNSLNWREGQVSAMRSGIQLFVDIESEAERTSVSVRENLTNLAGGLFGGIMGGIGLGVGLGIGLGVGIGEMNSALFASLFPPAVLLSSYLLSRGIFTAVATHRKRSLRDLSERILRLLKEKS